LRTRRRSSPGSSATTIAHGLPIRWKLLRLRAPLVASCV
jgi:hypothetical protein